MIHPPYRRPNANSNALETHHVTCTHSCATSRVNQPLNPEENSDNPFVKVTGILLFEKTAPLAILNLDKPEVGVELGLSPQESLRIAVGNPVR